MFELRLNHFGRYFQEAVEALAGLSSFVDVDVSPNRMILSTLGNFSHGHHVHVLLRIHPTIFSLIVSDGVGRSFSLDVNDLLLCLRRAGDDTVSIRGLANPNLIQIATVGPPHRILIQDVAVTRSFDQLQVPSELFYRYYTCIGIPSHFFRWLITNLYYFGLEVYVLATSSTVTFTAGNQFFVLRREANPWECIILGASLPECAASFNFNLEFIHIFQDLCELSNIVWLYHSPQFPPVLDFPVGAIGNLMFYFN